MPPVKHFFFDVNKSINTSKQRAIKGDLIQTIKTSTI